MSERMISNSKRNSNLRLTGCERTGHLRIDWKQPRHRIPSAWPLEMLIYSEEFNLAHSSRGRRPAGMKPRIRYSVRVLFRPLWTQEYIKSRFGLLTFRALRFRPASV